METIKLRFRCSTSTTEEGRLYYQISHNNVTRYINSRYVIYKSEWNNTAKTILPAADKQRCRYLDSISLRLKFGIKRLSEIIKYLEENTIQYTVDDIINVYNNKIKGISIFNFILDNAQYLHELNRVRTAETYISMLNSFMRFLNGRDMPVTGLNSDITQRYEAALKRKGSSLNTISFYMRALRAIYNRAVEKGIIQQSQPIFRRVYTGIDKTVKRAIPLKLIHKIKSLELTHLPELEFARDIFLFSFYTRGMSFIDIAYLRKSDVKNGILSYRRRKTGQTLNIKWEKCMEKISNKHPNTGNEYLLPIITKADGTERSQYIKAEAKINRKLKKIAQLADITSNLTSYVARHSWASAAKSKNIPISIISEGMGHENETTTQIYLASLDTAVIDKANSLIINSI